jgi:hypothetical protein|tara:strand:+ start:2279 stop:3175 length:897 start_codon:yes stop_codon:yes gene_type:complete
MIIENVPEEFKPHYKSTYPEYSEGKNIEEICYNYFFREKDKIFTEYIYLPVFWTSYYIIKDYGKNINPLLKYLNSLNNNKKYFTIVQYASGIYIDENINNLLVFSAGGGGLNKKKQCVREDIFFNLRRYIFYGNISNYTIPLICNPLFPSISCEKNIYCSFMGRLDTHKCRMIMYNKLKFNKNFSFYKSKDFSTYKNILNRSIFTLAPRGYGYTSYRIYEAILAESIPIYIWENKKVLPFEEILDWKEFSIIIHEKDIDNLPNILENCDIKTMQNKLKEIKKFFNFNYIFHYIKSKII